jgi:uncharacterized protein YegL
MRSTKNSFTFYAVYFVLDVSSSMRESPTTNSFDSPFEQFRVLLPDLLLAMRDSAQVRSSCFFSVLAFASEATTVLEAAPLDKAMPAVPEFPPAGQTDFAGAFRLLLERIAIDKESIERYEAPALDPSTEVDVNPLVFFITDGYPYVGSDYQPIEEWLNPRNEIVQKHDGEIVTFGLAGAEESALARIATGSAEAVNGFVADGRISTKKLADNIVGAVFQSVARSLAAGRLIVKQPDGMRRVTWQ